MFPFLAPIRAPSTRCRISLDPNRPVEMIFYSDIPTLEERARNASGSSESSRSNLDTNRPKSRNVTKSPSTLSQLSSARSAKSSPIPPSVPEVVPPYQRHKNKGLETSSAMMELFGGALSYGPSSAVQSNPPAPKDSFHGRKAFLQKELEERARWEAVKEPSSSTEPHFSQVEDHVAAYHRATTRAGRKPTDSAFDSQPGPEYETFEDKQDEEESICPAAKILEEMESVTISSPKRPSVSEVVPLDQPGPDLGDEDEADGSSSIGRDPDDESQCDAAVGDAEETIKQDDESTGEGGPMLIIRGAQIVNDDSIFSADVLVQDGVIKDVGTGLEIPDGCQVIEAAGKGLMLMPAGIDIHTHLSAPESCDDLPTGCRAALAGGTATIVDLVVPNGEESLSAAVSRVKKSFDSVSCNYAFSVVIKSFSESVKKEMEKVVADGINSFVVDVDSDDKLYQVLEVCHSLGAHARILPENKNVVSLLEKKMLSLGITGPEGFLQSRPVELEKERISSICLISQLTNCPVSILSVSSTEALESIEKARGNGAMTHPEIATAAVASSSAKYFEKDIKQAAAHMTDIPLRNDANRLVNALTSQPLAVCASGHRAISSASRTSAHNFTNMARGGAGVEERMSVVWEKAVRKGRIDPMRFVAVTSTNAAKIFNLYPKKGRIAVGADADLVLWDTTIKRKLGALVGQSGEDVSLYDGFGVHAQAVVTIVGGRIAWKDGGLKDAQGEFIALSPNSPYLFSVVQHRNKTSNYEKVEREGTSNGVNGSKKSFDNTPARPAVRKTHYDSNIVFGTESNRATANRDRNPPGGRSTNLW